MDNQKQFLWKRHPKAESLILDILSECVEGNRAIQDLQHHMHTFTSTRLFDWLDYVAVNYSGALEHEMQEVGFEAEDAASSYRVFHHPGAQLPRIILNDDDEAPTGVAVNVEHISSYLMCQGINRWIEGSPYSGFRRCCLSKKNNVALWAVERRGTLVMEPTYQDDEYLNQYFECREKWLIRNRSHEDDDEAMKIAIQIAGEMAHLLGEDLAAAIVLECEREYWQARNTAGQLQKNRQDRLGLGWGNHDHHTFRSSRRRFVQLVRLFEILGFHCRERFYAGEEAGWGAQVMENPRAKLILFLDVDLDPNELEIDFAHHPLPELPHLGTIGLWCELHGDSILKAGMHHLEGQFLFEDLKEDLSHIGMGMMEPFSNFDYLKQAFTTGEIWQVDPKRVNHLLEEGKITSEQAQKFKTYGAVGSHLENLQRREGYKGFNQKNVSFIIKETDPRKATNS